MVVRINLLLLVWLTIYWIALLAILVGVGGKTTLLREGWSLKLYARRSSPGEPFKSIVPVKKYVNYGQKLRITNFEALLMLIEKSKIHINSVTERKKFEKSDKIGTTNLDFCENVTLLTHVLVKISKFTHSANFFIKTSKCHP